MEEALIAALLANAGLTAVVGTRIHWDLLPQGVAKPALVLQLIDGPGRYVYGGRVGLTAYRVQGDIYAERKSQAKAGARALVAAIEALTAPFEKGFLIDERSGLDEAAARAIGEAATPLYRASLDVRVWHFDS